MSSPNEDRSNPFLKPTTVLASLFGGSVPSTTSATNTTDIFGNTIAGGGSSLFGGRHSVSSSSNTFSLAATNPEGATGKITIFGGPNSDGSSAATASSGSVFGSQMPSLFSRSSSNTSTSTSKTASSVSTTSLFGGVTNLGSHAKHSLFGGLDVKKSSSDGSSNENLFHAADKANSSSTNIHSLFGSIESENIATVKQFGSTQRSNQQEPKVSSSWETRSSFSPIGSTSLFGGINTGSQAAKDSAPFNRSQTSSQLNQQTASSTIPNRAQTSSSQLNQRQASSTLHNKFQTSSQLNQKTASSALPNSSRTSTQLNQQPASSTLHNRSQASNQLNQQPASSTLPTKSRTSGQLDQQPVPKIVTLFGSNKVSSSNNRNPLGDSRSGSRGSYDQTTRPHLFPRSSATSSDDKCPIVAATTRHAVSTCPSSHVFALQSAPTLKVELSKNFSASSSVDPQHNKSRVKSPVDSRPITSYDDIFDLSNESSPAQKSGGKKSPSFSEKVEPTAIIALNVPNDFLDKNILKNHFSKFGTIERVCLHATANQAQINFVNHESAAMAKKHGKVLHQNISPLMIFFATAARTRPDDSQDNQARHKRNNAVKFLRQSSSESQEKRKITRKPSKESIRSSRPKTDIEKVIPKLEPKSATLSRLPALTQSVAATKNFDESKPTPSDTSKPPTVVCAKDFAALKQVKAVNSQDRYNLLDSRDKLLRKLQTKEVDVRKAQYLSATCPDMCPEKERYMREVQFDLSPYEMTTDRKVDHQRAVKKFSRSSADKDEPLPHELRAGPVLVMTMNYLVCNMLNEMEDGTGTDMDLCYNYLWDRTRAMRSDIMQQHLLDSSAVYVFERCVRFHVFCSERLCLEPPDVFDPKMNMEHLSKSLHSLKELYHDMAQNHTYFDTEAEFRAYDILLNVDDGDIMFAYLLFREPVRKSREVQFAISVLHAIQSNNYVRFFRLVSEATFLQACILHRYFSRVRSKALNILVKAFHVPGKSQSINLVKLSRLLSFGSVSDVAGFLAPHGLSVGANSRIVMDRASFITHPEEAIPVGRAFHVVGVKKQVSVAEVINGCPIPPNPLGSHLVHDSFTPDGFLEARATTASDQGPDAAVRADSAASRVSLDSSRQPPSTDLVSHTPSAPAPAVRTSPDEGLGAEEPSPIKGLEQFEEKMQHKMMRNCFTRWRAVVDQSMELQNAIECLKQTAQQELIEEWRVRTAFKSRTKSVLQLVTFKLKKKYFSCWKENCDRAKKLKQIRRRILSRRVVRKWFKFVEGRKTSRYLQSVRCVVKEKLFLIRLRRCVQRWRWNAHVSKTVSHLQSKRRSALMSKYFSLWCKYIKEKEWQKKKVYEGFPSGTCRLSLHEQNQAWNFNCGNLKRSFRDLYKFEEEAEVKRVKTDMIQKLSEQICKTPLPVYPSFERFINSKSVPKNCKQKFFTLIVCFEENIDPFVSNWMRIKLNPSQNAKPVQINCSYVIKSLLSSEDHVVQIIESKKELIRRIKGVSSVLFVTETATPNESMYFSDNIAISSKRFFLNKKVCLSPTTSSNLMNAIIELYKRSGPALNLKACTLNQLVTSFVSKHVLDVATATERLRKEMHYAPLPSAAYSSLLHNALEHLRSALLSPRVAGLEWHASQSTADKPQLCKMSARVCDSVAHALDECRLSPCPLKRCDTWTNAFECIEEYIQLAFEAEVSAKHGLVEDIVWLVEQARQSVIKQNIAPAGCDTLPHSLLLPWKGIYCALIARKLTKVPAVDIICCVDDLNKYICKNDWLLPHWQPATAVSALQPSHKRKAIHNLELQQTETRAKRVQPESAILRQLADEKIKSTAFEAHLQGLLDESESPLVQLSEKQHHQELLNPDTEELYDMSEPSLLDKIVREKNKQLAFEEKLRQMLC